MLTLFLTVALFLCLVGVASSSSLSTGSCPGLIVDPSFFQRRCPISTAPKMAMAPPKDDLFRPFKILYMVDEKIPTDDANRKAIDKSVEHVHNRLPKIVQARKLDDIRFTQVEIDGTQSCIPVCHDPDFRNQIPAPYLKQCPVAPPNADINVNITKDPNHEARDLMKKYEFTAVILVVIKGIGSGKTSNFSCGEYKNLAAMTMTCDFDCDSMRHTHGRIAFCIEPKTMSDVEMRQTLYHETLHLLLPDLFGSWDYEANKCEFHPNSQERIRNCPKVFAKISQSGASKDRYFAKLGRLPQLARDRTKNDGLPGAEVSYQIAAYNQKGEFDFAHWNEKVFPDELMSAADHQTTRTFTTLTVSALENHGGWYKVKVGELYTHEVDPDNSCGRASFDCAMLVISIVFIGTLIFA